MRDEQRKLLRTFATEEVAEQLLREGFSLGGKHIKGSAMFTDIRSFTTLAESQDPTNTIDLLNSYYALMFDAITGYGGTINPMLGDGIIAIFGALALKEEHAERAVFAAMEMIDLIEVFNQQQAMEHKPQIKIGIGIASGQEVKFKGKKQAVNVFAINKY